MGTDLSSAIYTSVPPLQRLQFSWRWLAIGATTLPLLWGYWLRVAMTRWRWLAVAGQPLKSGQRQRSQVLVIALVSLAGLVAIASVGQSAHVYTSTQYDRPLVKEFIRLSAGKTYPHEPSQQPVSPFFHWHWRFPDGLGLADVWEYRAKDVSLALPPERPIPPLAWSNREFEDSGLGLLKLTEWNYSWRRFTATNVSIAPESLVIRTFFYPGWAASIDGHPLPLQASNEGLLELAIPPGQHTISLCYRGTWAYQLGRGITGTSIVAIALAVVQSSRHHKHAVEELQSQE